jgi:RHS repeat-associated protein
VTSSLAETLESYDYDDFGKPRFFGPTGATLSQSAIGNPVLLHGRRYDAALGLYDFRTRTMDPRTGRFLSRDSIGEWGDPSALGNGYTFAGNNPWSGTDPSGTAVVTSAILKTFFQTGDFPTQALVSRNILKSFFEKGDQPTAAQFGALIDSMVNRLDDRNLLGLKQYDPTLVYLAGDSVVYGSAVYKERKDMLQWYQDMVAGSGRITKPGVDKLTWGRMSAPRDVTMDPGTLWMMKLCPGHVSCPTNPFPGGSDPLGYTRRGYGVNTRSDTYLTADR